ncbi:MULTISPECIES: tetratricopeptide repeat protein [unclassified Duganella]|uniref:tetratricopeptide repeat protein n=1 Tax=unclassified Duganella TaxID=2636909 RepID=UPI000E357DAA|nr:MULTISPECIES: tetratricopeptide repeat protein [unclassified Duganella]RFP12763.1 tetratricopeptide repeat protein [Duganella sp. BJB475]RFP28772.1 tetratricopeptide repeat protein [Duganella sp. BJB476]
MKKIRVLTMVLALASVHAYAYATVLPNEAAKPLVQEGSVLAAQGKYQDALNKFSAAMKADPAASMPLSHIAHVLLMASLNGNGDNAAKLRQQSEGVARQALALDAQDPLAQEVLRSLLDDKDAPLHVPSPDAWKLTQEGEVLYQGQKLDEARAKYEQAAKLDPQYSSALVYIGDTYYTQKNMPEAEAYFRKAAELEPLNGQAWRFYSDALAQQGKRAAAETALLSGIAAQPSQRPNWDKLASLRAANGYPLTALKMQRKARAEMDPATGKFTIHLDDKFSPPAEQKSPDGAVWLALALKESNIRSKNREDKVADKPFAIELASWQGAMQVADELAANGAGEVTDPNLKTMRMLAKAGQLETALMLLQYKESWRLEFEAWKREHPDGIRKFVDAYGLRP